MGASREELAGLRDAFERALGMPKPGNAPATDRDWRRHWPVLAEMGAPLFCVSEEHGGFGVDAAAALVAARAFGAVLHPSPFPGIAAASFALSRWLEPGLRSAIVSEIASGEHVPTLGFLDASARIEQGAGGWRIDGSARLVLAGPEADSFLLVRPGASEMLFVQRDEGVTHGAHDAFDVTRAIADLVLVRAPATPVEAGAAGRRRTERLYGLLLAGDALGGLAQMLERTRAYTLGREAFGRPLAGFQAVQHRLVDHAVSTRGLHLLADDAAAQMTEHGGEAQREGLLVEASVAATATHVLHDLLQLTGAIGFTWEHGLHLYERRAHLDARLGRNPRAALRAIAELEGWHGDRASVPPG